MTHLGFEDELIQNRFTNTNSYIYASVVETNLRFYEDTQNFPFIMRSPWQTDRTVLKYSPYTNQLRGRLLNTAKIEEVMDTSPMPLMFQIRGKWYMIGKGFLAHVTNMSNFIESVKLLFVACINGSQRSLRLEIADVRFFISREIYNEEYKAILPAVKNIMLAHTGDVILTSNLNDRVGDKISFPPGGSLGARQAYKRAVMIECLKDYFA